jgi:hypothetical protein
MVLDEIRINGQSADQESTGDKENEGEHPDRQGHPLSQDSGIGWGNKNRRDI